MCFVCKLTLEAFEILSTTFVNFHVIFPERAGTSDFKKSSRLCEALS